MTEDTNTVLTELSLLAPNYREPHGEQAFYAALTVNFSWFEREMKSLRKLLRHRPQPSPRPVAASH